MGENLEELTNAVVGSFTEKFLRDMVAPRIVSKSGKITILAIYALCVPVIIYGCLSIKLKSELELYLDEGMFMWNYEQADLKYFPFKTETNTYTERLSYDFFSEEDQVAIYAFNEAYARCDGCRQSWHVPNTFKSWYSVLLDYIRDEKCPHVIEEHLKPDVFTKTMPPSLLRRCLFYWLREDDVGNYYQNFLFPETEREA